MKLRRKEPGNAELDMSAFSDIAFLLIIFFILTTTFIKPFGHKLDIPSGTSDPEKKEQQRLSVHLEGEKILFGEKGRNITLEELRANLDREQFRKREQDDRMVVVECTEDVPYEQYFKVVMAIVEADGVLALIEEEDAEQ